MAHYTVHPSSFYGLDFIPKIFTYNWAKSWICSRHFLDRSGVVGSALYLGPMPAAGAPSRGCWLICSLRVVLVVAGTFVGTVLGIKGCGKHWFWIGHQGWEFSNWAACGRSCVRRLIMWLVLVVRGSSRIWLRQDRWGTVRSTPIRIAVVSFFAFGLFYNRARISPSPISGDGGGSHLVEGIFESSRRRDGLVITSLGLAPKKKALAGGVSDGVPGDVLGHHRRGPSLYWFGDPDIWLLSAASSPRWSGAHLLLL